MLTMRQLISWCQPITFRDWALTITQKETGFLMQWEWETTDSNTGIPYQAKSRKWYISEYSCKSEVISTALKAAITAAEHEVREDFRYNDVQIFNPHVSIEFLASMETEVRVQGEIV